MAAMGSGRGTMDSQNQIQSDTVDRLKLLYPNVNEDETPLPRSWSTKDKFSYIGLSQNNLRVHYKDQNGGILKTFKYLKPVSLHEQIVDTSEAKEIYKDCFMWRFVVAVYYSGK
ncbi:Ran-binding protein 10 [Eumeta japonica]|uniref:Ran-binding protein 10 n=1 Tax=Eumeta variegata TaxID=151549 RepID=A0A4C1V1K2_EUMVA|nr:Ran-binding protein 10 [Eumeta japonica]